jgi:hypothetical protein
MFFLFLLGNGSEQTEKKKVRAKVAGEKKERDYDPSHVTPPTPTRRYSDCGEKWRVVLLFTFVMVVPFPFFFAAS